MLELICGILGQSFGGFPGGALPAKLIFHLFGSSSEKFFCSQLLSQQFLCLLPALHGAVSDDAFAGKLSSKIFGALLDALLCRLDFNELGGETPRLPFFGLGRRRCARQSSDTAQQK